MYSETEKDALVEQYFKSGYEAGKKDAKKEAEIQAIGPHVYIILGHETGEWRSWVEGIYTDRLEAYDAMTALEEADDWGHSYHIVNGPVNNPEYYKDL